MSADAEPAAGDDASGGGDGGGGGLERPDEPPEWLSLDEGEELMWVGRPSSASLIPAAVWGVVLLLFFGLGLLVFAAAYLSVKHTDYVVTNTTLYHKRGVLSTNIESVGLDRIQNTEYSQSFFGKQLGYGTIEISTAGSGGADLSFTSVENPRDVRDLVNRLGKSAGGGDGTGGPGGATAAGEGATAAAGGADEELLRELVAELRAVNESMENVERMLRAERGGGTRGAGTTGSGRAGSGGGSGSAASGGTGSAGGRGTSDAAGGSTGSGGSGTGGSGGAGTGETGGGPGTSEAGGTTGGSRGTGTTGSGGTGDAGDEETDTASEFVSSSAEPADEEDDEDEEPPAPPFGDDGG